MEPEKSNIPDTTPQTTPIGSTTSSDAQSLPEAKAAEPTSQTESEVKPQFNPSKQKMLLVVAAAILIALIVGGGYFLYAKSKSTTQPTSTPISSPEPTAEAADPTADWKTYTNQVAGISFKYPSNWQTYGDFVFSNGSIKNTPQENFIEPKDNNDFALVSLNSRKNTNNESLEHITKLSYSPAKFEKTLLGGKTAVRVTQDSENVSQYGKIVSIWFQDNPDTFYFIQLESFNLEKYKPIFDQILSTFKFLDDKSTSPYFSTPAADTKISSPLGVKGTVPAGWMFEGQLPIKLLDSKRKVIVATNAQEVTPGSWQSGNPVEFSTTLNWMASSLGGSTSGYLIISKDNPSGLPENEKSYEIPVKF